MIKAFYKYFNLPGCEKIMFMEALFLLYGVKFILFFFTFKQIANFISKNKYTYSSIKESKAGQIKSAIARANRLAFWKNKCLVQSLAARWMLQLREIPSQLSLGVTFNENKKLIAHAWIRVNNFEIVNKNLNYKELIVIN